MQMTVHEKIHVISREDLGDKIQFKPRLSHDHTPWALKSPAFDFNFEAYDYRVRTKPREWCVPPDMLDDHNYRYSDYLAAGYVRVREVL